MPTTPPPVATKAEAIERVTTLKDKLLRHRYAALNIAGGTFYHVIRVSRRGGYPLWSGKAYLIRRVTGEVTEVPPTRHGEAILRTIDSLNTHCCRA